MQIALLVLLTGCVDTSPPVPKVVAPTTSAMPPAKQVEEQEVVELVYFNTNPDGKKVGIPGPDDDLVSIVRHQNGKLWTGKPVTFDTTSGSRGVSVQKGVPPYLHHIVVVTDENGVARVYLQPFPKD